MNVNVTKFVVTQNWSENPVFVPEYGPSSFAGDGLGLAVGYWVGTGLDVGCCVGPGLAVATGVDVPVGPDVSV